MVRINAHAQLSRRNENAQAAMMVSLEKLVFVMNIHYLRTSGKKFHPLAKEDMLSAEWICTVKIG